MLMKTKFYYLLGIFITLLTSLLSIILGLNYIDPDVNFQMGIIILVISSFFVVSSSLALLIYFFKKIYYRWEIYIKNINSSLRQWSLLSLFAISSAVFYHIGVLNIITFVLLLVIIVLVELIFQSFNG